MKEGFCRLLPKRTSLSQESRFILATNVDAGKLSVIQCAEVAAESLQPEVRLWFGILSFFHLSPVGSILPKVLAAVFVAGSRKIGGHRLRLQQCSQHVRFSAITGNMGGFSSSLFDLILF
jgi:hypothetical protein